MYNNIFFNSFNDKEYVRRHRDLQIISKYKHNKINCWEHFEIYGWNENRHKCFNDKSLLELYIQNKIKFKNITRIKTDITQNYIHEDEILITKNLNNKLRFNPKKISIDFINKIDTFILIIDFYNRGGGTTNFINHIV